MNGETIERGVLRCLIALLVVSVGGLVLAVAAYLAYQWLVSSWSVKTIVLVAVALVVVVARRLPDWVLE